MLLGFFERICYQFFQKIIKIEKYFVINISPAIPYLEKFWFLSYKPKQYWPIKLQYSLECNISRKRIMKFIFGMQMNMEVFYKLMPSRVECAQLGMLKVPKKDICISLQYFQNTKVYQQAKIWKLLILGTLGFLQNNSAQSTQNNKVTILLQYLKKLVSDEVVFCMQINMNVSHKLTL